jgi:hypothetical protein
VEAEDGDDNQNGQANNDYASNNRKIYADDTSYGVGCVDKAFAMKTFKGRYCDERSGPLVTDSLKTFNSEINRAKCTVVYDATSSNNNNNQDEGGDGDENNDALNLLKYSEACNILNFPDGCPDPYGKLKAHSRSTAHALAVEEHPRREKAKTAMSWILLIFGIILLIASAWAYYRKRTAVREVPKETKKKGMFTGSLKTSSSKISTKSDGSSVNRKKLGFWGKLRRGKS